jgi:hypothetical protein
MPAVVHGWDDLASAEIPYADGRVGTVGDRESAGVRGPELAWRASSSVLGVPENGARSGELVGDAQLGRGGGRGGGAGLLGGGAWLGRFGRQSEEVRERPWGMHRLYRRPE